jgi:MoaA/NifB/PqqE/SkfB family radical SAM enzyme
MKIEQISSPGIKQRAKSFSSQESSLIERVYSEHPFPYAAMLILTEECNLFCGHCFVCKPQNECLLSTEQLATAFDQLAEAGVLYLCLSGGEPLLRRDIVKIVREGAIRRFALKMKTNGILLTDRLVNDLREAGLLEIDFSLYSVNSQSHDEFVGHKGAFEKTVKAARRFLRAGGVVTIANVLMNWNASELEEMTQFCESEGFYYNYTPTLDCKNNGDLTPVSLGLGKERLAEVLSSRKLLETGGDFAGQRALESTLCGAGGSSLSIMPNGTLKLCQRLPYEIGNISDGCFKDTWLKSPIVKWFNDLKWRDVVGCRDCSISGYCSRCPATALLEMGSILSTNPRECDVAHTMFRASHTQ